MCRLHASKSISLPGWNKYEAEGAVWSAPVQTIYEGIQTLEAQEATCYKREGFDEAAIQKLEDHSSGPHDQATAMPQKLSDVERFAKNFNSNPPMFPSIKAAQEYLNALSGKIQTEIYPDSLETPYGLASEIWSVGTVWLSILCGTHHATGIKNSLPYLGLHSFVMRNDTRYRMRPYGDVIKNMIGLGMKSQLRTWFLSPHYCPSFANEWRLYVETDKGSQKLTAAGEQILDLISTMLSGKPHLRLEIFEKILHLEEAALLSMEQDHVEKVVPEKTAPLSMP